MELADFDVVAAADKGSELKLMLPNGQVAKDSEGQPIRFMVLGFDSEKVIQAGRDFDREFAKHKSDMTQQEYQRAKNAHLASVAVTNWDAIDLTIHGEALNGFSAVRLLNNRSFAWIADQICVHGGFRGNYFGPASKGS